MLAIHKNELGFMLGYLGESHDDARYYRGDWFLTQDLLSMDDDGYLTYFGRTDTILKVDGGFRVSLMQVESVIKSCSGVKDVSFGAVDDDYQMPRHLYFVISLPDSARGKLLRSKLLELSIIYKYCYRLPHH
jgi:acyl-coenzyme A synthetase/AMP-(fatty) acid ligase